MADAGSRELAKSVTSPPRPIRTSYEAGDTELMLKSGMRNVGIAARVK